MSIEKAHYNRLIEAAKAEQILNNSKVYLNIPLLKILINKSNDNELHKYYHAGHETGFIKSKYYSRDKITGRIFTAPNTQFNFITLSNKRVKECIISRYGDGGVIIEFDFKQFEPSIMSHLIGYNFKEDIHTAISEQFNISRNDAKKLNNAYFYGMSPENINKLIDVHEYFAYMNEFGLAKNNYLKPIEDFYNKNGYIINPYGRKIYPKNTSNIFNNVIQSTGSDILIDSIINIQNQNKFNILFHRFDSLFFDMKKSDVYLYLNQLNNLMCINKLNIKFDTQIYIGKNLNNLKKLKL